MDLERFILAHNKSYETALKEIKNGYKESHWMWYIFPQIRGLGMSEIAQYYEISNLDEAKEYLANDLLRSHLFEISQALLNLSTNDPLEVLGYPDNLKLKSCMTLFNYIEPNSIFQKVLDKYYNGEIDMMTILILERENILKKEL